MGPQRATATAQTVTRWPRWQIRPRRTPLHARVAVLPGVLLPPRSSPALARHTCRGGRHSGSQRHRSSGGGGTAHRYVPTRTSPRTRSDRCHQAVTASCFLAAAAAAERERCHRSDRRWRRKAPPCGTHGFRVARRCRAPLCSGACRCRAMPTPCDDGCTTRALLCLQPPVHSRRCPRAA